MSTPSSHSKCDCRGLDHTMGRVSLVRPCLPVATIMTTLLVAAGLPNRYHHPELVMGQIVLKTAQYDYSTTLEQLTWDPTGSTLYIPDANAYVIVKIINTFSLPVTTSPAQWTSRASIVAGQSGVYGDASLSEVRPAVARFCKPYGITGWPRYAIGPSSTTPAQQIGTSMQWVGLWVCEGFQNHAIRFINFLRGNNVTVVAGGSGVAGDADGIGNRATLNSPHNIAWGRFQLSSIATTSSTKSTLTLSSNWTTVLFWTDTAGHCVRQGVPLLNRTRRPLTGSVSDPLQDMVLNVTTFAGLCGTNGVGTGPVYQEPVFDTPWGIALLNTVPMTSLPSRRRTSWFNTTMVMFVGETINDRLSMITPLFPSDRRYLVPLVDDYFLAFSGISVTNVKTRPVTAGISPSLYRCQFELFTGRETSSVFMKVSISLMYNSSSGSVVIDPNTPALYEDWTTASSGSRNVALVLHPYPSPMSGTNGTLLVLTSALSTASVSDALQFYCCLNESYAVPIVVQDNDVNWPSSPTPSWTRTLSGFSKTWRKKNATKSVRRWTDTRSISLTGSVSLTTVSRASKVRGHHHVTDSSSVSTSATTTASSSWSSSQTQIASSASSSFSSASSSQSMTRVMSSLSLSFSLTRRFTHSGSASTLRNRESNTTTLADMTTSFSSSWTSNYMSTSHSFTVVLSPAQPVSASTRAAVASMSMVTVMSGSPVASALATMGLAERCLAPVDVFAGPLSFPSSIAPSWRIGNSTDHVRLPYYRAAAVGSLIAHAVVLLLTGAIMVVMLKIGVIHRTKSRLSDIILRLPLAAAIALDGLLLDGGVSGGATAVALAGAPELGYLCCGMIGPAVVVATVAAITWNRRSSFNEKWLIEEAKMRKVQFVQRQRATLFGRVHESTVGLGGWRGIEGVDRMTRSAYAKYRGPNGASAATDGGGDWRSRISPYSFVVATAVSILISGLRSMATPTSCVVPSALIAVCFTVTLLFYAVVRPMPSVVKNGVVLAVALYAAINAWVLMVAAMNGSGLLLTVALRMAEWQIYISGINTAVWVVSFLLSQWVSHRAKQQQQSEQQDDVDLGTPTTTVRLFMSPDDRQVLDGLLEMTVENEFDQQERGLLSGMASPAPGTASPAPPPHGLDFLFLGTATPGPSPHGLHPNRLSTSISPVPSSGGLDALLPGNALPAVSRPAMPLSHLIDLRSANPI